jgi:hypothetical protein
MYNHHSKNKLHKGPFTFKIPDGSIKKDFTKSIGNAQKVSLISNLSLGNFTISCDPKFKYGKIQTKNIQIKDMIRKEGYILEILFIRYFFQLKELL